MKGYQDISPWPQIPKSMFVYKEKGEKYLCIAGERTGCRLKEGCLLNVALLFIAADMVEVLQRSCWPRTGMVHKLLWLAVLVIQ